jgi:hypothetical protein
VSLKVSLTLQTVFPQHCSYLNQKSSGHLKNQNLFIPKLLNGDYLDDSPVFFKTQKQIRFQNIYPEALRLGGIKLDGREKDHNTALV